MATINLSPFKPVVGTQSDANLVDNAYDTIQGAINGGLDTNNLAADAGIKTSQLADTPPGTELARAQITANVTVASTTESAGTTVLTLPAFTAAGTSSYDIEFYAPFLNLSGAGFSVVSVFEGATQLGRIAEFTNGAAASGDATMFARLRVTPSAGAHTYTLTAYKSGVGFTALVGAGAGGASQYAPAYARVVTV